MKKRLTAVLLLLLAAALCAPACGEEQAEALTYAVFPYVPDPGYYQELIEARWAVLEPDIPLVRAEWNCYHDGKPEGIDVVMYDATLRDRLIADGWIRPVDREALWEAGDIFPYALEGFTAGEELYGIPAFLCGNFLIYDTEDETLAAAERLTDLEGESGILVINLEDSTNGRQYAIEVIADVLGEANPAVDGGAEENLRLLDSLAVDGHKQDGDEEVARAYDAGTGRGYIGFSESMRLLENRLDTTSIKAVSFSGQENTPRVYADAVAVTAGTEGQRYEKCLELMNVMTEANILAALSVQDGAPQYLLLPRKAPYRLLSARFPLYEQLEKLAEDENNHVILTP